MVRKRGGMFRRLFSTFKKMRPRRSPTDDEILSNYHRVPIATRTRISPSKNAEHVDFNDPETLKFMMEDDSMRKYWNQMPLATAVHLEDLSPASEQGRKNPIFEEAEPIAPRLTDKGVVSYSPEKDPKNIIRRAKSRYYRPLRKPRTKVNL